MYHVCSLQPIILAQGDLQNPAAATTAIRSLRTTGRLISVGQSVVWSLTAELIVLYGLAQTYQNATITTTKIKLC